MKNYFPSGRNILWRYPEKIKGRISNILSSIIQNIQQSSTMYYVPYKRLKNLRISPLTMSRKIRRHNTQIHTRRAAANFILFCMTATHVRTAAYTQRTGTFYKVQQNEINGDTRSQMTFDTDSYVLAVDNCCSSPITNNIKDFVDTPRKK